MAAIVERPWWGVGCNLRALCSRNCSNPDHGARSRNGEAVTPSPLGSPWEHGPEGEKRPGPKPGRQAQAERPEPSAD